MRRFVSYGPVNNKLHYYVPRTELINKAYTHLTGEDPREGGHYITVWAPRQTGKTWIMLRVLEQIRKQNTGNGNLHIDADVVKVDLDLPDQDTNLDNIAAAIAEEIFIELGKKNPGIDSLNQIPALFTRDVLDKPLILLIDEFDALPKEGINRLTRVFRNIYMRRQKELNKPLNQRRYLLHGLALIGVRSVLGIESKTGSPFNIQRSVHIPNLTHDEVKGMFAWYEKESGQKVEDNVIDRLFAETCGQPGLTCWFGELLSEGFEGYKNDPNRPVTMKDFETVYAAATYALPNNNILNIISKAKEEENKQKVFEMFETGEKLEFSFDDPVINALYMNGIADKEIEEHTRYYLRFSCPFVQKRLFNYFSRELFHYMGRLVEPSDTLEDAITDEGLNPENIIKRYNAYLVKNREWLLKDAPRRKDMGIFEAVFHFNLYMYLYQLLKSKGADVIPQFPTGNGKIDIIIRYKDRVYGIELKSYTDYSGYKTALEQAARYGQQLSLKEILLVFFVEAIDRETREKYETQFLDKVSGVKVIPIFVDTADVRKML